MEYIDKSIVISEIERIIKSLERNSGCGGVFGDCQLAICDKILSIVNDIEVRKPIADEGLEDAADDYSFDILHDDVRESFIAGAQWQIEKMMEKAVDAKVCCVFPLKAYKEVHYSVHYPIGTLPHKDGDNVKLIITKENEDRKH